MSLFFCVHSHKSPVLSLLCIHRCPHTFDAMDCKVPCIERNLTDIAARGHFEAVLRFDSIFEEFNDMVM